MLELILKIRYKQSTHIKRIKVNSKKEAEEKLYQNLISHKKAKKINALLYDYIWGTAKWMS